jgi:putative transposase
MGIKRHGTAEVVAKLKEAQALAAQGKSQRDIVRALGISAMTYHRWRKAQGKIEDGAPPSRGDVDGQIDSLRAENEQLRRLLTDILLEKVRLEETLRRTLAPGGRASG